jgi:hypothetical protein
VLVYKPDTAGGLMTPEPIILGARRNRLLRCGHELSILNGKGMFRRFTILALVIALAASAAVALDACGSASSTAAQSTPTGSGVTPEAHPQAIDPTAGEQAVAVTPSDPIGDVNAHAPPLSQVRQELREEFIAVKANNANYIDPLQSVNHWERTDQGVDANLPVGAPILAPTRVKILGIEPNWYAGQPLVYFELLDGPDAGKVQYVAEQITDIAPAGSILQQGQPIARYAASGTGIEYGWSTLNGITLARATTGYEEGQITPAGAAMRDWLNSLGAGAGPWPPA